MCRPFKLVSFSKTKYRERERGDKKIERKRRESKRMGSKGDNVAVCNMKLERLLSMKGGKGQDSYANNSQAQVSTSLLIVNFIKKTSNNSIIFLSPVIKLEIYQEIMF